MGWQRFLGFGGLLLAGAVGCTGEVLEVPEALAEDDASIVGGRAYRGRDRAVVALVNDAGGLCTATLVAADVVLTARHCVSETIAEIDCSEKGAQFFGDRDPSTMTVLVGDDVATATVVARGVELVVPRSDRLCGQDIALLKLDRAVQGVQPLAVSRRTGSLVGHQLRAVGFGRRGDDRAAGRKVVRTHVQVIESTSRELVVGEVSCSGDSGGPAIDEATGEIVGVVSRGGPSCESPDARNIYTRTSAFAALLKQAGVPAL